MIKIMKILIIIKKIMIIKVKIMKKIIPEVKI